MQYAELLEYTFNDIRVKQRSITNLFPTFRDRVKNVQRNGGVEMRSMKPGLWTFDVASGTTPGKSYLIYAEFVEPEKKLAELIKDLDVWTDDRSDIDYRRLASAFLRKGDISWFCSCPSDLYWGGHYIRTQRGAKYTKPENRPPRKRNPNQYGAGCKHLQALWDVLPMYNPTFASYFKKFYKKFIDSEVSKIEKERELYRKAAEELKKKREEVKKEEEKEEK